MILALAGAGQIGAIVDYVRWCNGQRPHSRTERLTPDEAYPAAIPTVKQAA